MQWALPARLREEPHGEPCVPGAEQVQAFVAVGVLGFLFLYLKYWLPLSGREEYLGMESGPRETLMRMGSVLG